MTVFRPVTVQTDCGTAFTVVGPNRDGVVILSVDLGNGQGAVLPGLAPDDARRIAEAMLTAAT